jgi:hypothetical protein
MLIGNLLASPWGRDTAWAFTKAQWKRMSEKLGVFQGLPQIATAIGGFCTTASAAELRTFFARNPLPSSARTLQQALERVDNCAAMAARQSPVLGRWLAAYSGN